MKFDRYLETCGKNFFHKTRPLFSFLILLLPILSVGIFLLFQNYQIEELEERFAFALKKEKTALSRKKRKELFLQRYSNTNPYFLDQQIESLCFLQREEKELHSLLPVFPHHRNFKDRALFLKNGENRLIFTEETVQSSSQIKETEERQRRPVQVDEEDLKALLCLIEDIPIETYTPSSSSPQLLLRDFRMKKQLSPLQIENYEIEMNLFKREFSR